ncbi:Beta-hexosaminidase subunit beta [Halotydeus destructor]|nr:Beta-hexosaminidase subunit beta [Halotydeus destructor]
MWRTDSLFKAEKIKIYLLILIVSGLGTTFTSFFIDCLPQLSPGGQETSKSGSSHSGNGNEKLNFRGLWPMPQKFQPIDAIVTIEPKKFEFVIQGEQLANCDILVEAIKRYRVIAFINDCNQVNRKAGTFNPVGATEQSLPNQSNSSTSYSNSLVIVIQNGLCERMPSLGMSESYQLDVRADSSKLTANSVWGALRGLETFSQLVNCYGSHCYAKVSSTVDYPRFAHRGVMLDTGRHFLPVNTILRNIEAMEYNKLNVFHWHIVDDQSFPFVSKAFPELSEHGAYSQNHVYTADDVQRVIEFARLRGIRVLVEFDTPGHALSWGKGVKGLTASCSKDASYSALDVSKESTYTFLDQFFAEVAAIFPDPYLHLGGDEVGLDCWEKDDNVRKFRAKAKMTTVQLQHFYFRHLLAIAAKNNRTPIVWQDVFDKGAELPDDVIIQVWWWGWNEKMAEITKKGKKLILSSHWYLNHIAKDGVDWEPFYEADPHDFLGTEQQKALVIGGEVAMWGEHVDASNLIPRLWPRASAPAERLWSSRDTKGARKAKGRLEGQRCRMQARGIRVAPLNGPGYCPCDHAIIS